MKKITRKLFLGLAIISGVLNTLNADQQIQDDLVVVGSGCFGFDCVNGESFNFDTIRLKENNLRIKFIDTSSGSSFPGNDWQITINDSANGGSNYFAIEDIDSSKTPFKVLAGAPTNSVNISNSGHVGFGTSAPLVDLHTKTGNTPALRLEQDGSSGFTSQAWDVGGNETNFFIRDVTNGSKLPFRIVPNAPNGAFYIAADGDIGMGTTTPDMGLDINNASIPAIRISQDANGDGGWGFFAHEDELSISKADNGYLGERGALKIKRTADTNSLVIDAGRVSVLKDLAVGESVTIGGALEVTGNIVSLGTVFNASDKNLKENIIKVDNDKILQKVNSLDISLWNYKKEDKSIRHIGPMAQDFYRIFKVGKNNKTISSLDAAAVSIASVKALSKKLNESNKMIDSLKKQIEALKMTESRIRNIERLIKKSSVFTTTPRETQSSKYQDEE